MSHTRLRMASDEQPLPAATHPGPSGTMSTGTMSSSTGASGASCAWPGASTKPTARPWLSARATALVPKPPRGRPSRRFAERNRLTSRWSRPALDPPFWPHPPRTGGRGCCCRPRTPCQVPHRHPALAPGPAGAPTRQGGPSGSSTAPPSTIRPAPGGIARHLAPFSCRQMIASTVRRNSCGSVLPRGRTASTKGASAAHRASDRTPYKPLPLIQPMWKHTASPNRA